MSNFLKILSLPLTLMFLGSCQVRPTFFFYKIAAKTRISAEDVIRKTQGSIPEEITLNRGIDRDYSDHCKNRFLKFENRVSGMCIINNNVYIYGMIGNHSNDINFYLTSPSLKDINALIQTQKQNVENYFKEEKIEFLVEEPKALASYDFDTMLKQDLKDEQENAPKIPDWLKIKMGLVGPNDVLEMFMYKGKEVYEIPARCCDIPGELYDTKGNKVCTLGGGFANYVSPECKDFQSNSRLIYAFKRKEK